METRPGFELEQVNLTHLSLNSYRLRGDEKTPKIAALPTSITVRVDWPCVPVCFINVNL